VESTEPESELLEVEVESADADAELDMTHLFLTFVCLVFFENFRSFDCHYSVRVITETMLSDEDDELMHWNEVQEAITR
jgi:hypothetical protein